MVISKRPTRLKKTLLTSTISTVKGNKKMTSTEKIRKALKNHPDGIPMATIRNESGVRSIGQVHGLINDMIRYGEVTYHECPHCSSTTLYKSA